VQRGIATDLRWTWIFGTILILVVVVVIGFLSGITSALNSIDRALGTTDATLEEVGGQADPLPTYIQRINGNLTDIDKALRPIPNQAGQILSSLTSIDRSAARINASLGNTSSSLLNTSGSLVDTSGTLGMTSTSLSGTSGGLVGTTDVLRPILSSLRDTSGILVTIDSRVKTINRVLRQAQTPASDGTQAIVDRVATINNPQGLTGALADANRINAGLTDAHNHLESICGSTASQALALIAGNAGKC